MSTLSTWEFRKITLEVRIRQLRVLYSVPLFSETPTSVPLQLRSSRFRGFRVQGASLGFGVWGFIRVLVVNGLGVNVLPF